MRGIRRPGEGSDDDVDQHDDDGDDELPPLETKAASSSELWHSCGESI